MLMQAYPIQGKLLGFMIVCFIYRVTYLTHQPLQWIQKKICWVRLFLFKLTYLVSTSVDIISDRCTLIDDIILLVKKTFEVRCIQKKGVIVFMIRGPNHQKTTIWTACVYAMSHMKKWQQRVDTIILIHNCFRGNNIKNNLLNCKFISLSKNVPYYGFFK